jgi:hypothetical protein
MGLPYSRQINAAFEEVTPLVAAGFKVLQTTRNISIILAVVQVLTVFLLFLILIALFALLYSVNPDLEVTVTLSYSISPLPLSDIILTRPTARAQSSNNADTAQHRAHFGLGYRTESAKHGRGPGWHGVCGVEIVSGKAVVERCGV